MSSLCRIFCEVFALDLAEKQCPRFSPAFPQCSFEGEADALPSAKVLNHRLRAEAGKSLPSRSENATRSNFTFISEMPKLVGDPLHYRLIHIQIALTDIRQFQRLKGRVRGPAQVMRNAAANHKAAFCTRHCQRKQTVALECSEKLVGFPVLADGHVEELSQVLEVFGELIQPA